jgi:hypothetical protein
LPYTPAASHRLDSQPNPSAHKSDYDEITDIVSLLGIEYEVQRAFLDYCSKQSESLVEQYWPYIEAVAQALYNTNNSPQTSSSK